MCEKDVTGFYDYEGAKIPVCLEHYGDGTFANYLAAQQRLHADGAKRWWVCECGMDNEPELQSCVVCGAPRR